MTYQVQEFFVSQNSEAQPPNSKKRIVNNRNKCWYPSCPSPSESLLIECKVEERHFIGDTSPYDNIDSYSKPIRFTMNDQLQPAQFRSEVILHNNPETDLQIKRLFVNFHFHDDTPENALRNESPTSFTVPSLHRRSLDIPKNSIKQNLKQKKQNDSQKPQSTTSSHFNEFLHQWVDDLCANKHLMKSDDIVFFIKNGEFFARI
ncbi:unnamed protein product [Rotaria socialis]|uniref:Uncharacterized protein n=2 Tax=Rotaria socialis TaxID=392032 RepID=A0A817QRB4_9BILA|nr:unnamed protein product [Rotaria socialis]CAF3221355.1 unnamed protein product [Rotaria socialis]CAF4299565.1 unnamed protein product [Rotaria socialis]